MGSFIDLTGKQFGKLTVINRAGTDHCKHVIWNCICDCGNKKILRSNNLRSHHQQSCGCETSNILSKLSKKHGHNTDFNGKSSTYNSWDNMNQRCRNPKNTNYPRYGAKGITVCERWMGINGFVNFLSDMGEKPTPKHSIDRIDTNKGYYPENCRWATRKEQHRNKNNNIWYEYNGERLILTDWSKKLKTSSNSLKEHINKHGIESAYAHFSNKQVSV